MFRKGQAVTLELLGPGALRSEESATVLRVDKRGVWLDNGPGNDPTGPFDPKTGCHYDDGYIIAMRRQIKATAKK